MQREVQYQVNDLTLEELLLSYKLERGFLLVEMNRFSPRDMPVESYQKLLVLEQDIRALTECMSDF